VRWILRTDAGKIVEVDFETGVGVQIPAESTWHLFSVYHENAALLCDSKCGRDRTPTLFTWSSTRQILGAFENCEKLPLVLSCLSVHPSAWNPLSLDEFSWNLIFEYFPKSVEKMQCPLKSDKYNGHFTWRSIYTFDHISLNSSLDAKCFRQKLLEKITINFLCTITFFSPENRAVYEIM
jgi:hypothetical protein